MKTARAKNPMGIPKRLHREWALELGPFGEVGTPKEMGKDLIKIAHMKNV